MTSNKNLLLGFMSIILLTTILGFTSIYKLLTLSEITRNMYDHPFTVSKAILQIKIQTGEIQHDMQILSSLDNVAEIHSAKIKMDEHHQIANENYQLIFERYLGDMKDIKNSYEIFLTWKDLRGEVTSFLITKDIQNAQASRVIELEHQYKIDTLLTTLEDFANNKAISYNQTAQTSKQNAVIIIFILFILIAIISIIIATVVIRNFSKSNQSIQRYFHLIEQNVNIAKLNYDTSIKEVTHSLARLLDSTKEELIETDTNHLFGTNEKQISEILKTIRSSKQYQGEVWVQSGSQKNLWLYIDVQPTLNHNFEIIGYTMIINDITSKKLLEVISITDGMTGLFNRREFDNTFEKRLNLVKREKTILVFIMIDIDYFKLYNDNYGHQSGDFALKGVAKALKATFSRPDDVVYRLGGEEFGVLFSVSNKDGVPVMAEKILNKVNSLKIKHEFNNASSFISVSMGVGIILATDQSNLNTENIYAEVDDALYKAKENGRNRYEVISIS